MNKENGNATKKAAAIATWIVLQAIERNPNHFREEKLVESESILEASFIHAENGDYDKAFTSMKSYIGKLLVQHPPILKGDQELMQALSSLASLDTAFIKQA